MGDWARRATVIAIFNPKGGVGKTTIATNLAAALQVATGPAGAARRRRHRHRPRHDVARAGAGADGRRQLARPDRGRPGPRRFDRDRLAPPVRAAGPAADLVAAAHRDPRAEPGRRRDRASLAATSTTSSSTSTRRTARSTGRSSSGPTGSSSPSRPTCPRSGRASSCATWPRDRHGGPAALVVNRATRGMSVADMERSANLPCYAEIRSAGMLLVKADNEGRTLLEIGPRETDHARTSSSSLRGSSGSRWSRRPSPSCACSAARSPSEPDPPRGALPPLTRCPTLTPAVWRA